jgi:hypothetical protein
MLEIIIKLKELIGWSFYVGKQLTYFYFLKFLLRNDSKYIKYLWPMIVVGGNITWDFFIAKAKVYKLLINSKVKREEIEEINERIEVKELDIIAVKQDILYINEQIKNLNIELIKQKVELLKERKGLLFEFTDDFWYMLFKVEEDCYENYKRIYILTEGRLGVEANHKEFVKYGWKKCYYVKIKILKDFFVDGVEYYKDNVYFLPLRIVGFMLLWLEVWL